MIAQRKLFKWEVKPVDCRAPAFDENGKEIKIKEQELFRDNDEMYSNQGETGLCVRHAVAKALMQCWRLKLGRKHPMNLKSIIAYLITSLPKGSSSAAVTDFANVKGQIADPATQKVYEMEIHLHENQYTGNILVLNLAKVYPNRGYTDPQYHAVCQQRVGEYPDG